MTEADKNGPNIPNAVKLAPCFSVDTLDSPPPRPTWPPLQCPPSRPRTCFRCGAVLDGELAEPTMACVRALA
jgi:hypothetical protein